MTDEMKCESCGAAMTSENEVCPGCGWQPGMNQPRETYEQLLEIIERLHGERDAALAGVEDTKRLRGYLAAVAGALAEGAAAGATGAFPIEHELAWFYKARSALGAAGYAIDHPVPPDHPQHAAAWVRATELVEHIDPQAHQFWATHAAEAQGERPAYMKITGDLCMHCERFGGAPERVRTLQLELAAVRSGGVAAELSTARVQEDLDTQRAKFKELSDAAQVIAADNKAKDNEIAALRAQLQAEGDGRKQAEKALEEVVAHARLQANQIDELAAAREVDAKTHAEAQGAVAELQQRANDHAAQLAELRETVAALKG